MNTMIECECPLFPFPSGVMLGYYFIRNIGLKNYIDKREKIISQLVDNCETSIVVAKKSSMFYTLIKHFVK